jgi:hypothetical protein
LNKHQQHSAFAPAPGNLQALRTIRRNAAVFGQSPDQISQMRYWLSTQLRYLFIGYALFAESGLADWLRGKIRA